MIRSFRRHLLNRFVLRPSRNKIDYAPKQRVLLTADGIIDECFVERRHQGTSIASDDCSAPDLLVVKFPGTAGRAERASAWPSGLLPELDIKLCTWNAPGYGGSSGRASLQSIPQRAQRFFANLLSQHQGDLPPIWLVGNSLGCATATYLASQYGGKVQGLILRNPPPLIPTVKRVARRYPLGHLTDSVAESLPAEMNLTLTAPRANVPTVMLQSEQDELVPPEMQMQIYDSLPGPKRLVVLEGLGHDGIATESHEVKIKESIQWLHQQHDNIHGPASRD